MTNEIRRGWYETDGGERVYVHGRSAVAGYIIYEHEYRQIETTDSLEGWQYLGVPSEKPETIDVGEWWVPVWNIGNDFNPTVGEHLCDSRDCAMRRAECKSLAGTKYGVMRVGSTVIEVGGVK